MRLTYVKKFPLGNLPRAPLSRFGSALATVFAAKPLCAEGADSTRSLVGLPLSPYGTLVKEI